MLLADERGHELAGLDGAGREEGQPAADEAAREEHGTIQLDVPLDAAGLLVPGERRGFRSNLRHGT
jgi:hypothetical protein